MSLIIKHLERDLSYTGVELRPHYILSEHKVEGDALLVFQGSCLVKTDHLVDWEDRMVNDSIQAKRMVHVLGEFFGPSLREGVALQRLLMALGYEHITRALQATKPMEAAKIKRDGDDLFWGTKKLSVSIVTASPVSVLLHAAINIDATGAPVEAAALADLGIDPKVFAQGWAQSFAEEWAGVRRACTKVRPVV